ncbi:hypothetical protein, partial [Rubrivirga sp.]|uniref:hypothetical protein n=1 Tax=Rubrivirga sp. TaxID=1885344 RepID=UPI003C7546AE
FQAAVARGVADLEGRLAQLRPYAAEDTTGGLLRGIDSVLADRDRLRARVGAYPDTTASQFLPFRSSVTDGLLSLDQRVTLLAADTTRVAPDTTSSM